MKTIVIFLSLLSLSAFAEKTSFANKEIVFPKGKVEIEKFLNLLKDPANRKVAHIKDGKVSFKEIPEEGSAIFYIGGNSYMLYHDDMNNDGRPEYLVIYLFSGSGSYSGVTGAFAVENQKLKSLNFNDVVVSNLFPGKDMSSFHLFLSRPFAVYANGKIYLRFQNQESATRIFTYLWEKQKFTPAEL